MSKRTFFDALGKAVVERTPQGFLRVKGRATRVGVLKYKTSDGKELRVLRDPKEVFASDSLETLVGVPVTLRHPPQMLSPENAKQYMVGFNSTVSRDGKYLTTDLTIADALAIQSVEEKKTSELSCGYGCDLDMTPGTFEGEAYDAVQRGIRYNHIALVERGRAGPDVKVLMDSDQAIFHDALVEVEPEQVAPKSTQEKEIQMEKIMIEGQEFEVAPELAAALKMHMEKMMSQGSELEDMKKKLDACAPMEQEKMAADAKVQELQAKCDALDADLKKMEDSLKTKIADSADEKIIAEKVKARIALEQTARRFIDEADLSEKTEIEIKKMVILKDHADAVLEGKSEEYVSARFDHIVEKTKSTDKKLADLGKKTVANDDNHKTLSVEEARKRQVERTLNGWKQELSK